MIVFRKKLLLFSDTDVSQSVRKSSVLVKLIAQARAYCWYRIMLELKYIILFTITIIQ